MREAERQTTEHSQSPRSARLTTPISCKVEPPRTRAAGGVWQSAFLTPRTVANVAIPEEPRFITRVACKTENVLRFSKPGCLDVIRLNRGKRVLTFCVVCDIMNTSKGKPNNERKFTYDYLSWNCYHYLYYHRCARRD